MNLSRDVSKLKVESEDGDDPVVDAGGWGCVGVIEHTVDISGIHFNDEISDTDYEDLISAESAEESIEF